MSSEYRELLEKLLNSDTTDVIPQSRAEHIMLTAINSLGIDTLPEPNSRMEAYLMALITKMGEGGSASQTQPDWDEPNSYSHAYIKNKPCYDYVEPSGVIWESDSAETSWRKPATLVDLVDGRLIEGATYRLTVDGVETTYTCAADADGRGLYIGAGYNDSNNGSIFQSNTDAILYAWTDGLWNDGEKVRLEGPLRKYKKLDNTLYDAVVSVNGETGEVQITPENIEAANVGSLVVSSISLSSVIHGTYRGKTCTSLYLGNERFFGSGTVADTGEHYFYFGPYDTILAGIKTPTNDNQAANKGYVDATVAALGAISFTATAAVGQTIKVSAVDENGRPTEWEAVDMEGVPTITTANNGQFLRVVNGAWAASTVPNAEEASF